MGSLVVENFIHDVSRYADTSRDLCECICYDLHQLLHQPWPPKPEKSLPKSEEQPSSGDAGNHSNKVSQEVETLAEVERTLLKAQKARELHRKLNLPETVDVHKNGEEVPVEPQLSTNEKPLDDSKPSSQLIDGQEFAIISQASLKTLFADVKPLKNNRDVTAKPRPGTAQARAAYSAKVPRPKPTAKSQYRTTYSEIGRNVVAKSKGNSASSRHSNLNQKLGDKVFAESAKLDHGLTSNVADRSKITNTAKNSKVPNMSLRFQDDHKNGRQMMDRKQNRSPLGCLENDKETKILEVVKEMSRKSYSGSDMKHVEQASDVSGLAQKTEKLKINDGSSNGLSLDKTNNLKADENEESKEPFMLRRDGCTLKVPTRLKKLYSDIAKLKHKLSSKAPPEDASLHFLHRLESKLNPEFSTPSFSDVRERLTALTSECQHLIGVAKTAVQTFPKQGEVFWESWYKVTILTKALRDKLSELKEVSKNVMAEHVTIPSTTTSANPPMQPSITHFLPSQYTALQDCIKQLGNHQLDCVNYEYNNLKEFQRLATLQHDVQRLSFQIQLEKLIAEEILPILESFDASDSSFITLYRAVYGLLCHGGLVYPAVIRDGVGNATEMEPT